MSENQFPEHEKLLALKEECGAVSEFLDFLSEKGYTICTYQEYGNNGELKYIDPDTDEPTGYEDYEERAKAKFRYPVKVWDMPINPGYHSWESGFYPIHKRGEEWIGELYDIDPEKISAEKGEMLRQIRGEVV